MGVLEASSTKLLDLPPLSVMDVYVRRLGARSIKQAAQGTSDDVRSIGAFVVFFSIFFILFCFIFLVVCKLSHIIIYITCQILHILTFSLFMNSFL